MISTLVFRIKFWMTPLAVPFDNDTGLWNGFSISNMIATTSPANLTLYLLTVPVLRVDNFDLQLISLPNSSSTSSVSTSTSTQPNPSGSSGSSSDKGAIIGGTVGGAVLLTLLGAITLWRRKRRSNDLKGSDFSTPFEEKGWTGYRSCQCWNLLKSKDPNRLTRCSASKFGFSQRSPQPNTAQNTIQSSSIYPEVQNDLSQLSNSDLLGGGGIGREDLNRMDTYPSFVPRG